MTDDLKVGGGVPPAPLEPRRWRCSDCGIPNQWDALACVRCQLIQPPDRERWTFRPFVRSERERLSTDSIVERAGGGVPPAPLERLQVRITEYLAVGGLFNPELIRPQAAVSRLLSDCRDGLAEAAQQIRTLEEEVSRARAKNVLLLSMAGALHGGLNPDAYNGVEAVRLLIEELRADLRTRTEERDHAVADLAEARDER